MQIFLQSRNGSKVEETQDEEAQQIQGQLPVHVHDMDNKTTWLQMKFQKTPFRAPV